MPTRTLGRRSTANDALGDTSLKGLRALITGPTSGIGTETARTLAKGGAELILACRSVDAGQRLASELAGKSRVLALDLTDLDSVRGCAQQVEGEIDLLICNAGVMGPPLGFTKQGFEMQMGVNHLAHFLLVTLLLPRLSASARVVVVASTAHRRGSAAGVLATLDTDRQYKARRYQRMVAYGDSKLANVLFARTLAKRLPAGQLAFSLHPGVIPTNLTRHFGVVVGALYKNLGPLVLKSAAQGAATTIYAATAAERSGSYLKDCHEATPQPDGRDDALADKVWALSEALVA